MPEHKSMIFVDGENFAIRGQEILSELIEQGLSNPFCEPSTFLWLPSANQARILEWYGLNRILFPPAIRSYYFTALISGNNKKLNDVMDKLKALDFDPHVFAAKKGEEDATRSSKLVDQSLTVSALHHAYQDNYDTALIISGDADYIPLIEELKSIGKRVHLAFFREIVRDPIRRAADRFIDLTEIFKKCWRVFNDENMIAYCDDYGMSRKNYKMDGYEVVPVETKWMAL